MIMRPVHIRAAVCKCNCALYMTCVACAEIIKDHKALTYSLKPKDLEDAAENACKLKTSEINTIFPDVSLSLASSVCFVSKHRSSKSCVACAIFCMSCTSLTVALS